MGRSPEDSKLGEAALQLESPCLVTMPMNDIGRCAETLRPYKMGGYAKLGSVFPRQDNLAVLNREVFRFSVQRRDTQKTWRGRALLRRTWGGGVFK
jgi:hypothetical protein